MLESIIDKLRDKYNKARIYADYALDTLFPDNGYSSSLKATSLALVPLTLAALKPAIVQAQEPYRHYEADLQGNIALSSFYLANFKFSPSYIASLETDGKNVVIAKNPGTGNLWYKEFRGNRAISEAIEIPNTQDVRGFAALNFDSQQGDERAVLRYEDSWHLYEVNNFEQFLQDLQERNGRRVTPESLADFFNLQEQPNSLFAIDVDGNSDDGIAFAGEYENSSVGRIDSSNASFRDNFGNFLDARRFITDLEQMLKSDFPDFSSVYDINVVNRGLGDNLVLVERIKPSLGQDLPSRLELDEDTRLENALMLNPNLEYRVSGNENITVEVNNGSITLIPRRDFNGRERIEITGRSVNGLEASHDLELVVTPVNDAPSVVLAARIPNGRLNQSYSLGNLVSASDVDNDPLSFRFRQTSGENVGISDSTSLTASFTPLLPGIYRFVFEVSDGKILVPVSLEVNVEGALFNAVLKDYLSNLPTSDVRVEVDNKSCTTNLEGRCNLTLDNLGEKLVRISGNDLFTEEVLANVDSRNYTLQWTTIPRDFPIDLYQTFYMPKGRLIKWRDYSRINAQIATEPTVIAQWRRDIPEGEMRENVELIKLLYRAGVKLISGIDIPDEGVRDVGGNPTYGPIENPLPNSPIGNIVVDFDDASMPPSFLSGRGIGTEDLNFIMPYIPDEGAAVARYSNFIVPYITDGRATFRTNLRELVPRSWRSGYIKEIFGILFDQGDPVSDERRTVFSNFFLSGLAEGIEEGVRNLLSQENIQDPGEAIYALLPIDDKKMITLARQRPSGHTILEGVFFSPSISDNGLFQ